MSDEPMKRPVAQKHGQLQSRHWIEAYRWDCNQVRPHGALDGRTIAEYASERGTQLALLGTAPGTRTMVGGTSCGAAAPAPRGASPAFLREAPVSVTKETGRPKDPRRLRSARMENRFSPGTCRASFVSHFRSSARFLGLLLALMTIVHASGAGATVYVEPRRPLTESDRLAMSVHFADAIVSGVLISVTDTLTGIRGVRAGTGRFRALVIFPQEWLKGRRRPGPLLVGLSPFERLEPETLTRMKAGASVIVFLRRIPDLRPGRPLAESAEIPLSNEIEWYLNSSPLDWHAGFATFPAEEARGLAAGAIRAELVQNDLPALAARAELVVIAEVIPGGAPCTLNGTNARCMSLTVKTLVAGRDPGPRIKVYSQLPAPIHGRRHLVFLSRRNGDAWEILGVAGQGMLLLDHGVVTRLGVSEQDAVHTVQSAHRRIKEE